MQDTSKARARTSRGTLIQRTAVKTLTAAVLLLGALTSTAQTNPSAYTTGYRYDPGSRLVGVIQPDPDGAGTLKFLAKRTTYNAQGLVSSEESGELSAWADQSILPANWVGYTVYNRKDYTYDNEGRKLTEKAFDPRNLSLEPTLTQYSMPFNCHPSVHKPNASLPSGGEPLSRPRSPSVKRHCTILLPPFMKPSPRRFSGAMGIGAIALIPI